MFAARSLFCLRTLGRWHLHAAPLALYAPTRNSARRALLLPPSPTGLRPPRSSAGASSLRSPRSRRATAAPSRAVRSAALGGCCSWGLFCSLAGFAGGTGCAEWIKPQALVKRSLQHPRPLAPLRRAQPASSPLTSLPTRSHPFSLPSLCRDRHCLSSQVQLAPCGGCR